MRHATSHYESERYREEQRVTMARAAHVTAACALALIPVFAYLDTVVFPTHATTFVTWRLVSWVSILTIFGLVSTPVGRRFPLLLGVSVPIAVGIDVNAVTLVTGRESNPYYAGLIVILLGVSLLLPWTPLAALLVSTALVGSYGVAMVATGPIADVPLFTCNLLMLGGSSALVVVGAVMAERMRRRDFQSRMALDAHALRQEAVARFGQLALGGTSTRELMDRAVAVVAEMFGFELAAVLDVETPGKTLCVRSGVGWQNGVVGRTVVIERGSQAEYALEHGAVASDDLAIETRFRPMPLLARHRAGSGISVPIDGRQRRVGLLLAFTTRPRPCATPEVECLEALARVLTTAILREEAAHALTAEAQSATALARLGHDLISSIETPVLLERLCQRTAEALGTDHSVTWLVDVEEQVYRPISCHGMPAEQWEMLRALRVPATAIASIVERLANDKPIELTPHSHEHPLASQISKHLGITRSLLLPLRRRGEIIGVQANGYRGRTEPFTPQQHQLGRTIAQIASMALSNARLVEELEDTSRLKSEFVSTMSHELRTPLNVILGYLDILSDAPAPAEQPMLIGRARTASLELLEMVDATLNLNRIAAGQDTPIFAEAGLRELWEELQADFAAIPRKTAAGLLWEPAGDATLHTDRRKLKIIVKNLVGNALKFTPAGEVLARYALEGDTCVITVRDTGIGIPIPHLPHIFDMFRQVDSSDTRSYAGAGLGLYIVKSLVAQLDGEIDVESTVGRGSTFRIRLPRIPAAAKAVATASPDAATARSNGTSATAAVSSTPRDGYERSQDSDEHTADADDCGGAAEPPVDRGAELASAASKIGATAVNVVATHTVAAGARPAAPHRRRRIVFADDLEVNRHLLQRLLARELPDVECFEAADGLQALALVETHKPDLVLLDLRMPEMDGWQAARRIRALEHGRNVPIIALSVTASPGAEAYALRAGCNEFFAKPVSDFSSLMARIRHWLGPIDVTLEAEPGDADSCVLCRQPLPRVRRRG